MFVVIMDDVVRFVLELYDKFVELDGKVVVYWCDMLVEFYKYMEDCFKDYLDDVFS